MAKSFATLRAGMASGHQSRAEDRTAAMRQLVPIHRLRLARRLAQETLGATLGTERASLSKLERRTDLYLTTLRSYVEAMGGVLEIRASFPDGVVHVQRLGDIGDADDEPLPEA